MFKSMQKSSSPNKYETNERVNNFFEKLSDEAALEVFKNLSTRDLASLAQVNLRFNTLVNDKNLSLKEYKDKTTVYRLGEIFILFKVDHEFKLNGKSYGNYTFKIMEPGDVKNSYIDDMRATIRRGAYAIRIEKHNFEALIAALDRGPLFLSEKLQLLGCDAIALRIEAEYKKLTETAQVTTIHKPKR